MNLHCGNKLHGVILDNGLVEVACQSRMCGKEAGNVVLHRFDPITGELIDTRRFKKPPTRKLDKEDKKVC